MLFADKEFSMEPLDIKFYTFEADVYLNEEEENQLYKDSSVLDAKRTPSKKKPSALDIRLMTYDNHKANKQGSNHRTSTGTSSKKESLGLNGNSLPPGSRSNLVNSRDVLNDKTASENKANLEKPLVPKDYYKNTNINSKSEIILPAGYKVPKFNKFSSSSSPKSKRFGKMEEEGRSKSNKHPSSIRRSRVLEKLVQKQINHKVESTNEEKFNTIDDYKRNGRDDKEKTRYVSGGYVSNSTYQKHLPNENSQNANKENIEQSRVSKTNGGFYSESSHELNYFSGDKTHNYNLSKSNDCLNEVEHKSLGRGKYSSIDHLNDRNTDEFSRNNYANHRDEQYNTNERKKHFSNPSLYSSSDYHHTEHSQRSQPSRHRESGYHSDSNNYHRDEEHQQYRERPGDCSAERYYSDSDLKGSSKPHQNGYQLDYKKAERVSFDYDSERKPQIRAPLVTERMSQFTSSKSTRSHDLEDRTAKERMQDLEETVLSLKRVLTDREKELDVVKCENRKFEESARELKSQKEAGSHHFVLESQKETEKRINDLIREKENMATEIWQLKRDLDKVTKGQLVTRASDEDKPNPKEQSGLIRKLEELESQVKDLKEVNETTANSLIRTEKELESLKMENETLRKSRSKRMMNLEDENHDLKKKLDRLSDGDINSSSDLNYLRRETDHLREDLSVLRDKNHQLIQDNIKLTEHLKDLEVKSKKSNVSKSSSVFHEDELLAECNRHKKEREAALEEVEFLRKQLHKTRRDDLLNSNSHQDSYKNGFTSCDSKIGSVNPSPLRTTNGHDAFHHTRRNSGSDMSDSTAVLTSAHPGYSINNAHSIYNQSSSINNSHVQDNLYKVSCSSTLQAKYNDFSLSGAANHQPTSRTDSVEDDLERTTPETSSLNYSLRSNSPKTVTLQHSTNMLNTSADCDTSLMSNKRPFCPRNPADLNLDDLVKFSRQGGKISRGTVKYIGPLPGKNDTYLGVELQHEMGKHDGLYEGQRYFQCKPSKGVFVAFSKVVMAYSA